MIRFLQAKDNRIVKAIFVVIIAVVSVGMVVYLIPGLTGMGASTADTFAVIYPNWYSRLLSSGVTITQQKVSQHASQEIQQRYPQYAGNAAIEHMIEQQVGQQMVQQQVLLLEAAKLGIQASDADVIQFLHQGKFGEFLFPDGVYIGTDRYADFVARQFNMPVPEFEQEVKDDIVVRRLEALVASGATVSDDEAREAYRKQNIKIKFDYAVISSEDLRKQINPTDADLQKFFKDNAARYAKAVPEQRQISYFAFTPGEIPGGIPQVSPEEIQRYYTAHQSEYSAPEQARSRHILIKVAPGADAKADAAAKAKADGLLKQIQGGANFAELAKANSDDPGSKDKGGELGFAKRGMMVPEFDNALFTQKISETKIVKSQFGYHIVQVEERQAAHAQSLSEVLMPIQITLLRQKLASSEENYAQALTSEAIKNGLEKTAAAHHLTVVTTAMVQEHGTIAAFADSVQVLEKAFASKQGDPPQFASTGEGFAIFQVSGIAPAHAPAFADWKENIANDYRDQTLPTLLSQRTNELAAKAKAGGDLAKAAKELGATVKSSDLVGESAQVPDLGQVGEVAPQLFELKPGDLSGAIQAGRTGVVAKIVDKQEPGADEIAKNLDQARNQILQQRRGDAFNVFLSTLMEDYKKHNRILEPRAKSQEIPAS